MAEHCRCYCEWGWYSENSCIVLEGGRGGGEVFWAQSPIVWFYFGWHYLCAGIVPAASDSMEVWISEEPWGLLAGSCPCGLDFFALRLLALLIALDQLCKGSVCCTNLLLLCRVIITGTDICIGTNGKDVTCAGRNYVTIMSPVLVGLLHL